MAAYFPIDGSLTFPYYSTTATANNPQGIAPPVTPNDILKSFINIPYD